MSDLTGTILVTGGMGFIGSNFVRYHTKIHAGLGWEPVIPFSTGLRQVVEWYRRHEDWWREILSGKYQTYYEQQYGRRSA